jgi:glutathione S-transferase
VQRAVIALRAKGIDFDVTYINLREKPDWFLKISPHGKVPVLVVDEQPLFESSAIAEYLDEATEPRLHPEDLLKRARNRAWTDFVPDFSRGVRGTYYSKTKEDNQKGVQEAEKVLQKLEDAISRERGNDGPYFNGDKLSLVDAAYAPFLQRFALADSKLHTGLLDKFPKVKAWLEALLAHDAVKGSLPDEFEETFVANLKRNEYYLGTLFEAESAAAE